MPPYECPERGARFNARFIRIGEKLYSGKNIHETHGHIAEMDHLKQAIGDLKRVNSAEVDGGIYHATSDGQILIIGNSATFDIPVSGVKRLARELTKEAFQAQSPGREVIIIK